MESTALIDQCLDGPRLLRNAVAGMSLEELIARPIPGKWSTLEIICHLADFEIIGAHRIKLMVAEEEPAFPSHDEKAFAARLAYDQRDAQEELLLIELLRKQVVRILRTLKPEDFQRRAIYSGTGALTLEEMVQKRTEHFLNHVQSIDEKRKALAQQVMAQQ